MKNKAKRVVSLLAATAIIIACVSSAFAALPQFMVTTTTNEGGYIVQLAVQYEVGTKVVLRAVPYDGFVFYAWQSDDVLLESYDTDVTRFTMPASNVTVGALFAVKQAEEKQTVSITYNTFGGTEFSESFVNVGECVPVPTNVPVKEGYDFAGWYSDAICTLPFNFDSPVYNATIIYAKWAPKETVSVQENAFSDVTKESWYYEYVMDLAEKNFISGMGNGTFAPNANISRAQFATILANVSGEAVLETETPFDDVSANAWYAKAVSWAYKNGIVNGKSEKEFAPNANISRQEMAVMIKRYVENVEKKSLFEENAQITFADDAEIAAYAREAVYLMQRAGIISGRPGNLFDAKANATRAEASKMIHILLSLVEK